MPGPSGVNKPGKFYTPATVNPDYVRLDQQYVEIVNSGDPSLIKVRLDQQYVEVVCTFGTAPVKTNNGKKDNPPGKNKTAAYLAADMRWRRMQVMDRKRQTRRFLSVAALAVSPVVIPRDYPKHVRKVDEIITSGADGHTVRYREV